MNVVAEKELQIEAHSALTRYWRQIQQYASRFPQFAGPHPWKDIDPDAPEVVKMIQEVAAEAGVAPTTVYDGALTEMVARELHGFSKQIMVENGPEVYVQTEKSRRVRIFAGHSPLSSRLVVEIPPEICPAGLSTHCCAENVFQKGSDEDAAVALASSLSVAAAFAAGAGERMTAGESLTDIHRWGSLKGELIGLLLIRGDLISKRGSVHLVGG
jgi:hypothetical protein